MPYSQNRQAPESDPTETQLRYKANNDLCVELDIAQ